MEITVYKILQDSDPFNPRMDCDMLGVMYTCHRNYRFGDPKWDTSVNSPPDSIDQFIWDLQPGELAGFPGYWMEDGEVRRTLTKEEQEEYWYLDARPGWDDERFEQLDQVWQDNEPSQEEAKAFLEAFETWKSENICILPLYLYDHSGITMRTSPFSCQWDSGQVGFIYCTKERCDELGADFSKAEDCLRAEVEEYDQYLTGDVYGYVSWEFKLEDLEDEEALSDLDRFDTLAENEHAKVVLWDGYSNLTDLEDWMESSGEVEEGHSCWGFYGQDYIKEELKAGAVRHCKWVAEKAVREASEQAERSRRTYWCM